MIRPKSTEPGPRAQRRTRKQARILAAARALLRDRGHERLSLRQVARRARMSPAGMYEFFDDREHLIDALATEAAEALVAALRTAMIETPDPVACLVGLGLSYIRFSQERPTDFLLLFGRRSTRRSLAEGIPEDSEYAVIHDAIADLVGAGGPDGASPRVLEMLAYGWWSLIHGMAMLQLTHLAGFDADFATANRSLLEGTARSWQRLGSTRVEPPATARCGDPGGE